MSKTTNTPTAPDSFAQWRHKAAEEFGVPERAIEDLARPLVWDRLGEFKSLDEWLVGKPQTGPIARSILESCWAWMCPVAKNTTSKGSKKRETRDT